MASNKTQKHFFTPRRLIIDEDELILVQIPMSYTMNCSCGDTMTVEAQDREQAVAKLADIMNEDSIARHMELNHPGEAIPSVEQTHAMIEQNLHPAQ